MPEDIKIPGMGEMDKKYVIWGVVAGVGVGVIVYFRSKSKATAAAAADTSGAGVVTDPAGNTCSVLDPNSGYCPGSPEDAAYQESLTGSYSGLGFNGGQFEGSGISTAGLVTDPAGNQCSFVNPATGFCPGTPQDVAATHPGTGTGTGTGSTITNTDWINEALGVLPGDQDTIRLALVNVFAGNTVTTAQKNIFQEAVGVIGPPPGPYPTPIHTSDTSAQPGSPSTPAGSSKKYASNPPKGLHLITNGKTAVTIGWDAVAGATGYTVYLHGHPQSKTTKTFENIGSLKPGTKYSVEVWADPTPTGGPHASLSFTTEK